ncbi:MAG: hypothetical protein ACRCTZ_00745 [Sarcina sp.]
MRGFNKFASLIFILITIEFAAYFSFMGILGEGYGIAGILGVCVLSLILNTIVIVSKGSIKGIILSILVGLLMVFGIPMMADIIQLKLALDSFLMEGLPFISLVILLASIMSAYKIFRNTER